MNCIVVPIYKDFENLTKVELTSLIQLYKVLGKHQIFFIGPQDFDWTKFLSHAKKRNFFPKVKEFDKFYFESIDGYNRLMISLDFLKKFKEFEYILIHQLDAYVFKDELEYWCNKGYDYIGAPWFEGWHGANQFSNMIGVGNGGFSLRNIQASRSILKARSRIRSLNKIWNTVYLYKIISLNHILLSFKSFFKIKNTYNLDTILVDSDLNEDYCWTQIYGSFFSNYNVAPIEEAIKFSFDVNPSLLFKLNNNSLPFGCHAWERYEPDFWKPFIESSNH
jgi:hypothetical protein